MNSSLPSIIWLMIGMAAILVALFAATLYFLPSRLMGKPQPTLRNAIWAALNGIAYAVISYFIVALVFSWLFDIDGVRFQPYFGYIAAAFLTVGMALSIRKTLYGTMLPDWQHAITLAVICSIVTFIGWQGVGKAVAFINGKHNVAGVAYFTTVNFKNPVLMEAVFNQKSAESAEFAGKDTQFVKYARLTNAFYVRHGIDYMKETCGWEPSGISYGVYLGLNAGETAMIGLSGLGMLVQAAESSDLGQAGTHVVSWLQGVSEFGQIRDYARTDAAKILVDANAAGAVDKCNNQFTRKLTDGFSWYLRSVAPLIILS